LALGFGKTHEKIRQSLKPEARKPKPKPKPEQPSIHIAERARSSSARIAARPARAAGRRRAAGRALRRNRKHGELRVQLGRVALRAFRPLFAEDEGFELVMAFLTDVFKYRHMISSGPFAVLAPLESIRADFAN
jgi:hypothetical protein